MSKFCPGSGLPTPQSYTDRPDPSTAGVLQGAGGAAAGVAPPAPLAEVPGASPSPTGEEAAP